MADSAVITTNVVDGATIDTNLETGVSITSSLVESTQVTSNIIAGGKGDKGDTGETGATGATGEAGPKGDTGAGVNSGGTTSQALTKIDDTDFNTQWTTIDKTFVGLDNVDNTADTDKPVSTLMQTALDAKLTAASDLSDLSNASTARTNLGLGSLATKSTVALTTDVTGILPVANGGAGTVSGIMKANGSGTVSAATAGTDYTSPSSTETLTHKTYDTAGSGNVFKIGGTAISAVTGSGSVVLSTSPTLTTPNIDQFDSSSGLGAAWSSWTPAWTNFTAGNGTLNYAKYKQIGKTTFFKIGFTLGSTSAVTGQITFSIPTTIVNDAIENNGYYYDTSAGKFFYLIGEKNDATSIKLFAVDSSGTYASLAVTSATVPVSFGAGDTIEVAGSYENS